VSALLKSTSIDAITLFTEDLERSKSFYQDVFGLPGAL
jgi:catechol 2,3-dioxygenase-like lactoylglutathione lyase family enzyme